MFLSLASLSLAVARGAKTDESNRSKGLSTVGHPDMFSPCFVVIIDRLCQRVAYSNVRFTLKVPGLNPACDKKCILCNHVQCEFDGNGPRFCIRLVRMAAWSAAATIATNAIYVDCFNDSRLL